MPNPTTAIVPFAWPVDDRNHRARGADAAVHEMCRLDAIVDRARASCAQEGVQLSPGSRRAPFGSAKLLETLSEDAGD